MIQALQRTDLTPDEEAVLDFPRPDPLPSEWEAGALIEHFLDQYDPKAQFRIMRHLKERLWERKVFV